MQVSELMVLAAAKALTEAEASHDRKEPWINHAARAALSAALSEQTLPVRVEQPDYWTTHNNFENLSSRQGFALEKGEVVWDFATQTWANADFPVSHSTLVDNSHASEAVVELTRTAEDFMHLFIQESGDERVLSTDDVDRDELIEAYQRLSAALSSIRSALVNNSHASEEVVEAWRTIETAPKDGTIILLVGGVYGGLPFPGKWDRSEFVSPVARWFSSISKGHLYNHVPTHWRPLPLLSSLHLAEVGSATATSGTPNGEQQHG